jgi:transposase-like protein
MRTLNEHFKRFPDEEACKEFLVECRWPDRVVRCPRCGNANVHPVKARPWHWQCRKCQKNGYRFSVISGTVFENTKYPLRTWFQVLYLMLQSKKGISALQIHRTIGSGDYRTAWYMCHRLRAAMQNGEFLKLTGQVEVDETFIGGKDKNRHWNRKSHIKGGSGKVAVIGAISRKGNVVCKIIEETDKYTLNQFVRKTVSDKVSLVATDEHAGYGNLSPTFPHGVVKHSAHEYVRGNIHTNNIESFWSLLKRGVVGTFHNVSKNYLPLYLNEFAFRHNFRQSPDIFAEALSSCRDATI